MIDQDISEAVDRLIRQYSYWGEHPDYKSEDWRTECANEETRQGYWFWVAGRMEEDMEDEAS